MSSNCQIIAMRSSDGYVVRVVGHGTMRESPAFSEFSKACLGGEAANLVVDLSGCEHLDSTFLGCLVSLVKRFRQDSTGQLIVAGPPERRKSLLSATHIEGLFEQIDDPPATFGDPRVIQPAEVDSRALGHHVLECHRELAQIDGPNQARFSAIVKRLAEDVKPD